MIAATYVQGQGFEMMDAPKPRIQSDQVLVKVQATAICGTDVKIIRNGSRKLAPGKRIVLGHEFVGVVEEVGSSVTALKPGACVGVAPNFGCGSCEACISGMANMCAGYSAFGIDIDGSHAPYVLIPSAAIAQGNVMELPIGTAWEEAALAEPLSCVLNGQHSVNLKAGDTVLIYGAGPMGLLHVVLAAASGATQIIMVDTNGQRLGKALEAGATATIESSRESVADRVKVETGGRGVDVVFTAASVVEIVPEALQILAPFGRLCLFAGLLKGKSTVTLDVNPIHYRNLTVTGTTGGCNADYRTAVQLIASRRVDVRPIISHVFPMSKIKDAYDVAISGQGQKIVIKAE